MKLFKKKTDYSYYSSYTSKSRRERVDRVVVAAIAGVVLFVAIVAFLNLNRIKLMVKGYSFSTANEIVASFDSGEEKEILSHDKMDHILNWAHESSKVSLFDEYEKYWSYHKKMKYSEVVEFVDSVFNNQVPQLKSMGYDEKTIWSLLKKDASKSDMQYLIDNHLTNEATKEYRKVKGYKLKNMLAYIEKYKEVHDYNYAVNIVNYPFIVSSNGDANVKYEISNPDSLLTLVKKGFYLPEDYEPKDLVVPNVSVAPDCENNKLRKAAAKAFEEMAKAAEKEDLHLVLNSGYRSYADQTKTYKEFETKYGGQYAAEYVAIPGGSEHQTGLGIDVTAQSVVEGKKLVFGDTEEYDWVIKHCSDYGFIIRFEEGTDNITGIAHEPWHVRYVGKAVAKEIIKNKWTFEEYCLYKNVIPSFKKD